MGDEKDRDPPGLEILDHGEEGLHLLLGQGGGGLVHDDEFRVLQKGAADRDELAVRDGEVLHALVEVDIEADEGDGVGGDGPGPAVVHQLAAVHELHVEGEVLHHAQVGEDGEILVDDLDAEGDGLHGSEAREGTSADLDAARVGLVDAGDHLDEGGLAGAVLAGKAVNLPRADLEAHPLESLHSSEGLDDPLDPQNGIRHLEPPRPPDIRKGADGSIAPRPRRHGEDREPRIRTCQRWPW